jgi:hypothetical protein
MLFILYLYLAYGLFEFVDALGEDPDEAAFGTLGNHSEISNGLEGLVDWR